MNQNLPYGANLFGVSDMSNAPRVISYDNPGYSSLLSQQAGGGAYGPDAQNSGRPNLVALGYPGSYDIGQGGGINTRGYRSSFGSSDVVPTDPRAANDGQLYAGRGAVDRTGSSSTGTLGVAAQTYGSVTIYRDSQVTQVQVPPDCDTIFVSSLPSGTRCVIQFLSHVNLLHHSFKPPVNCDSSGCTQVHLFDAFGVFGTIIRVHVDRSFAHIQFKVYFV